MLAGGARADGALLMGGQRKAALSARQAMRMGAGKEISAAPATGRAGEPPPQAMQQSRSCRAGAPGNSPPAGPEAQIDGAPPAAACAAEAAANIAASMML